MNNKNAIEVKHLTKSYKLYKNNKRRIIEGLFPHAKPQYNEFKALDDVSFEITKGEIVGIIGKNGSGKSTLLKIITGVLQQTAGEIRINGKISALLELGAGFNPEYTGIENIYLNGTLNRISREEMSTRINDIADFADIGDFIYQPVKNYSSGMFVRLAFAVAVYSDPDILIVDEALAVGDAAFQAKCMARMHQIMKSGATVLFVTHDMNTVKRLCKRCIYLEKGKKIMEGPAEELADIYLKRIRASMNEENEKIDLTYNEKGIETIGKDSLEKISLNTNKEFDKKVARFREGTGDVKVIDFQLTDLDNNPIKTVEFNQTVKLKIVVEFFKDKQVGVGYHIRDDKNMELLGSYIRMENDSLLKGNRGDKFLVEFTTRIPLIEGAYAISLVVSEPVIYNRTSLFDDFIDNVEVFEVLENPKAKLWDKVYIQNELKIVSVN